MPRMRSGKRFWLYWCSSPVRVGPDDLPSPQFIERQGMISLPSSLHFEPHGDIGVLRLTRAHKRNALDDDIVAGLEQFFSAVPDSIKAVVLHGEGEHFCAGLDLSELSKRDVSAGVAHSRSWHRAFEHIEFGRVPVVAL